MIGAIIGDIEDSDSATEKQQTKQNKTREVKAVTYRSVLFVGTQHPDKL